ncbi:aldo/keto reductase [Leifsonia sp. L25]|uniref:aldo/keto reductase n=1 Tax=Actinomycetes TaxID=1760 RepID=UPI003D68D9E9
MRTANPLEIRQLGNTLMAVTAIGLGGAGLGGVFGSVGDTDAVAAVERALELGINYVDTAPGYRDGERRTGLALRGVPRESYFLSSKIGSHPQIPGDYSAEAARWTVSNSLEVLGVDYLDLCHIHGPEPEQLAAALAQGGAMEALVALKDEGVIRAIGIGVQDHELHRRAIESGQLDVCMTVNDYTLLRQNVDDIFMLAQPRAIGMVNGAPLAMGLLSGRDPESIGTSLWSPPADEVHAAEKVHAWCSERGVSVLALALQFSLRRSEFDCTLVGAATAAEVEGCWEALNLEIPGHVWEALPTLLSEARVP